MRPTEQLMCELILLHTHCFLHCNVYIKKSWGIGVLVLIFKPTYSMMNLHFSRCTFITSRSLPCTIGDQVTDLVILNDGSDMRLDPHSGKTLCLDLSLVSSSLVWRCSWKVLPTNFGSDHFPILIDMHVGVPHIPVIDPVDTTYPWNFKNIDWNTYARLCKEKFNFRANL